MESRQMRCVQLIRGKMPLFLRNEWNDMNLVIV